jgi:hypothetical protein
MTGTTIRPMRSMRVGTARRVVSSSGAAMATGGTLKDSVAPQGDVARRAIDSNALPEHSLLRVLRI